MRRLALIFTVMIALCASGFLCDKPEPKPAPSPSVAPAEASPSEECPPGQEKIEGRCVVPGGSGGKDYSGTYAYSTSDGASGQCSIAQKGESATFVFLSGRVCSPASMCAFECAAAGPSFSCANSDVVDDEGGSASNVFSFTFAEDGSAQGAGRSEYVHPGGFSKDWAYSINIKGKK